MNLSIDNIILVLQDLKANKLRTILSLLGVSIGIFCIVSILTVFDSMQENIRKSVSVLGGSNLYIQKYPWIPDDNKEYPWWKYTTRPMANFDEVILLKKMLPNVSTICISYNDFIQVKNNEFEYMTSLYAVSSGFEKFQNFDLQFGRYFNINELLSSSSNLIVLGENVAKALFKESNRSLNQSVQIQNRLFTVIGVLKKKGKTQMGFDFNDGAIVSYLYYTTLKNLKNQDNSFVDPMILIAPQNNIAKAEFQFETQSALRTIRKLHPGEPDNFSINQMDAVQDKFDELFAKLKIGGWLIGLFSLIVGCFGIANIMYVSVKERTRQIGLKKALGATSQRILFDYLYESVILCLLGGLGGVLLVIPLAFLLTHLLEFEIILSLKNFLLATSISIGVGIISGFMPARKASKLNPVVAIRS